MRRGRATTRRVAGGCLAVVALVVLGGCGRATPGCDRAEANLAAARLGLAAEAYAAAADDGEGDCADAGLKTVGARYVTAYQNVARGRAAEIGHDRDAATTAYRAALGDDADNPAARDGLARVGQPPDAAPDAAPAASPSAAPPATSSPMPPSSPATGLLGAALALLGGLAVLLVGLWWWTRRRTAAAPDETPDQVWRRTTETRRAEIAAHRAPDPADEQRGALTTLQQSLDAQTDRIEEILRVDADRRPRWAEEQLVGLQALQQSVDKAVRDVDAAADGHATADVRDIVDQHSRRLRGDLVDLVAFLDHRLPGRRPTHDRFGTPAVDAETSW